VLVGEVVEWVLVWRSRGLVASNRDLVLQALRALNEKTIEQDIKLMRIRSETKKLERYKAEEENSVD
jgi:hypothetical protein